jgi:hypothetical protein
LCGSHGDRENHHAIKDVHAFSNILAPLARLPSFIPVPEVMNQIADNISQRLCPLLNGTVKQEDAFNNAAFMNAPPGH